MLRFRKLIISTMLGGSLLPALAATCTSIALCPIESAAQTVQAIDVSGITIDAFVHRGDEFRGTATCDIYVQIPNQTLMFQEFKGKFAAQYAVVVSIRDTNGRRLADTSFTRSVIEESYSTAKGATGRSDRTVSVFALKPEAYKVDVQVTDKFSHREYTLSKRIVVEDLTVTPGMSSILYLSEIEQKGKRYSITPYVGDVIRTNLTTLFAFFEVYEDQLPTTVFTIWNISDGDNRVLTSGVSERFNVNQRVKQFFVPVKLPRSPLPGAYKLVVRIVPERNGVPDSTVVFASRTKPFIIPGSFSSNITADINKAIRQLVYVATQEQIDSINAPADLYEKQVRFNEFWKSVDPTPNTVQNEAFEDYYSRIENANRRFKSYTEGWLTDMGRVFIIFGEPTSIDRYMSQNNTVQNIRWIYGNRLSLIFEDNTGFGDFRLRTPLPSGSKYRYR